MSLHMYSQLLIFHMLLHFTMDFPLVLKYGVCCLCLLRFLGCILYLLLLCRNNLMRSFLSFSFILALLIKNLGLHFLSRCCLTLVLLSCSYRLIGFCQGIHNLEELSCCPLGPGIRLSLLCRCSYRCSGDLHLEGPPSTNE